MVMGTPFSTKRVRDRRVAMDELMRSSNDGDSEAEDDDDEEDDECEDDECELEEWAEEFGCDE